MIFRLSIIFLSKPLVDRFEGWVVFGCTLLIIAQQVKCFHVLFQKTK